MKFIRILLLLVLPVYLFSCKPQQKLPYYLENVTDSAGKGDVKIPELRIQKNDQLAIQIFSLSTEPKADEIYNQPSVGVAGQGSEGAGYFVDLNGNIKHHRLGVIHAEGLTKQELAAEIKKRLTVPVELLKDPTVIIRFLNFTITVLGQVGREGPIKVPGERVTILEAVGLAGGVTDYGKKNNLRIVREQDGKREIGFIDLSSKDIFESPYYHLVQNDVLIVEATSAKMKEDQAGPPKISFAFTLVTVAATIANIFIK
jgi:polysaccharide export outer membrane protein